MSKLSSRVNALERAVPQENTGIRFFHRVFLRPGPSGPIKLEPMRYRTRLTDGVEIQSKPGETVEKFFERAREEDTGPGGVYSIIDVTKEPDR